MSSSRDDFGIAIRSALLKKGARQKFSLVFLLIIATIIFLLDTYQFKFIKGKELTKLAFKFLYKIAIKSYPHSFLLIEL